ncbi:MAG: hypothetical protein HY547_10075 [Elusimicrobia bacterium]|nr:hypothetical protein [Elusimicrobiota bacterium]
MMKKRIIRAVLLLLGWPSAAAFGQVDFVGKDVMAGFKFGYLGSGTVKVEGVAFATDASRTLGAFLDYRVAEKLYVGAHLNLHNMSAFGFSEDLMDFGGAFKAVIPTKNKNLVLRPCLNMGYGALPEIAIGGYAVDGSSYFLIGPSLEILVRSQGGQDLMAEAGFLSAPMGGNSDFTIVLSPTLFLRAGIAF